MLAMDFVREKTSQVKENLKKRGKIDLIKEVDELLNVDSLWRKKKQELDDLRHRRNTISLEINKAKKEGNDISFLLKEVKEIPGRIGKLEDEVDGLKKRIDEIQRKLPNILDKSVGLKNKVVFKYGVAKKKKILGHAEIAEKLGVADFDASSRVSGNGFYYLKGGLARLNLALIQFAVDFLVSKKFVYVEPPLMIRRNVCDAVIDMDFFKEHVYKIEGEDLHLIGTSEHPLIALYMNKTLREKDLPIKHVGYSMCFRKEIGSHGIDEKGIFRTHQFNKVEQVVICKPEDSSKHYDLLLENSKSLLKKLKLPFRILEFGAPEVGDWKARYADVEVWSPRKGDYIEVMSCSNLTEFQSRKLGIKAQGSGETYYPHTLNNTAIATSRLMVAILENYQTAKGTVKVPAVLQKYMGGLKEIK